MPNTYLTPTAYMKEVGRRFLNALTFGANVDRSYDDRFSGDGGKVGYTVNARLPQRFLVAEGQALQLQPITDTGTPISLTHQKHVAFSWSMADRTMIIEEIRNRYVNPAADALANMVDWDGLQTVTKDVYQSVGTPGTVANSNLTYLQAGAKLSNFGVSSGGRIAVLDPIAQITLVNANQALFGVPLSARNEQWSSGQFSDAALGVDRWLMDQNIWRETYGTYGGSPIVNGAGQTGSSLVTSGWTSGASTLKKGDTFTIAGVYTVNSMNYTSTGQLQDFVVTSDISDTTGAMTIPIAPAIITSGAYQTVDSSPANSAVITVRGATGAVSPNGLIYQREAFALVTADLAAPTAGVETTRIQNRALGLSMRMLRQYQIGTDQEPTRIDILYGWATVRPEMAVRIQN